MSLKKYSVLPLRSEIWPGGRAHAITLQRRIRPGSDVESERKPRVALKSKDPWFARDLTLTQRWFLRTNDGQPA